MVHILALIADCYDISASPKKQRVVELPPLVALLDAVGHDGVVTRNLPSEVLVSFGFYELFRIGIRGTFDHRLFLVEFPDIEILAIGFDDNVVISDHS